MLTSCVCSNALFLSVLTCIFMWGKLKSLFVVISYSNKIMLTVSYYQFSLLRKLTLVLLQIKPKTWAYSNHGICSKTVVIQIIINLSTNKQKITVTTLLKPCLIFIRVLYYYSTIFSFQMYVVQNKYCFKVSIFVNIKFSVSKNGNRKKLVTLYFKLSLL